MASSAVPYSLAAVTRMSWLVQLNDPTVASALLPLRRALAAAAHVDGEPGRGSDGLADASGPQDVLALWSDAPLPDDVLDRLLDGRSGRGERSPVLLLGGPTLDADASGRLAAAAGLRPGPASAVHDVRVRPAPGVPALAGRVADHAHTGSAHLGEHLHLRDRVLAVQPAADDVQVLLTANLGLTAHPVATWRPSTRVLCWTPGTVPDGLAGRGVTRALLLVLRHALGVAEPAPVRVGLLGYGAIGHEHSRAVRATPGLELAAVADPSAQRRSAAAEAVPGLRTHADGAELLEQDDLDLVVVSTPPSTHADWARRVLAAGRHVVVEKPFAICTKEADEILALAAERGRYAAVYQNRRFDPDHRALRRVVGSGAIGDVFHLETFVGGYGHPCNLWHSDAAVSGGAFYDWGSHTLDQILDLMPDPVEHVTAAEHKRVWLDVTNADHSRVTLTFATGAEATFVYSDLAAALKPRWYVLGTRGAVVGHWRTERIVSRSDIGTLAEDVLAPSDSPPVLDLHAADGSVTRLATPPAPPYAFHAELADALQLGLPASVTGEQSRRVLAVMEAAAASAQSGGRPVEPR